MRQKGKVLFVYCVEEPQVALSENVNFEFIWVLVYFILLLFKNPNTKQTSHSVTSFT